MEDQKIYINEEPTQMPIVETAADTVKAARKTVSRVGFRLFFGLLITYVVVYAVSFIVLKFKPEWSEDPTMSLLVSVVPQYLFGMTAMIALVWPLPHKAPEKKSVTFGFCFRSFVITYSLMMAANFIGTMIAATISLATGTGSTTYAVQTFILEANQWVVILVAVIIGPIVEEFIFRKLIVDRVGKYGEAVSALVSGVLFGLFHGNLIQGLYAFVIGYFFALIYSKTGKIYVTMGIHIAINFMGSVIAPQLLKLLDLNKLIEVYKSGDASAILSFAEQNATGILVLMVYEFVVYGLLIAGIILCIVNRRTYFPSKGEIQLPKKSAFKVAVLNPGVLCVVGLMVVMMVINFVAG